MSQYWIYVDPFVSAWHESSFIFGVIFFLIIELPVLIYLWIGWPWKKNDIMVMMTSKAKDKYLSVFQKQTPNEIDAEQRFKTFYNKWYGRKLYFFPAVLIGIFAFYFGVSIGETACYYVNQENGVQPQTDLFARLPLTAAAAISGGFAFVSWDLTIRATRRDMSWNDVLLGALRLSICVPLGYSMGSLLNSSVAPFIAFAIAVLPIDALETLLRRILNKNYGLDIGADSDHDQISKISGIDPNTADRISEADIITIAQLAYCDPIQLAMRTNLNFAYLLDGISQALAWLYLDASLNDLRLIGIRGAYEMKSLWDDLKVARAGSNELADQIAAKLKLTRQQFDNLFEQTAEDPYTEFLTQVFNK